MSNTTDPENYYCNRVMRSIHRIALATMALHGRGIYNMYSMFGRADGSRR